MNKILLTLLIFTSSLQMLTAFTPLEKKRMRREFKENIDTYLHNHAQNNPEFKEVYTDINFMNRIKQRALDCAIAKTYLLNEYKGFDIANNGGNAKAHVTLLGCLHEAFNEWLAIQETIGQKEIYTY